MVWRSDSDNWSKLHLLSTFMFRKLSCGFWGITCSLSLTSRLLSNLFLSQVPALQVKAQDKAYQPQKQGRTRGAKILGLST